MWSASLSIQLYPNRFKYSLFGKQTDKLDTKEYVEYDEFKQ